MEPVIPKQVTVAVHISEKIVAGLWLFSIAFAV